MSAAKKFGTFGGVFTPSILTILGVIMYLRLPSIVGQGGLWTAIGIIIVAHVISVATGLSVASIATDKKVQAGGTYYMLSRSIGLPIGGTLGLALFVGLSFSVSLYVIGFSESFLSYWGWEVSKNMVRIAGSITLLAVTTVTLISTSLALKTQFFIMAAIVLSLLSIVFGNHDLGPAETLTTAIPTAVPFIVLFGIFFPAVTGFEAGVSMSGDLKDPKKSIPSGTIWAIVVGLVVYLVLATYLSKTVSVDQLVNNPNILLDISLFAPAVVAGIWGATISSALGSILGAPRILQATAADRIVHPFFAKGYGKENEPRHALILTFIIAEAGILIGELDVIARIVSMFFITTYGFLNLSCFIESWSSPDFRPDFKIPKVISLIGTTACFVVMIQLDFLAMIGATVLLGLVFVYLKRKELTLESGDTWEGFWSSVLRSGLQRLSRIDVHERNWRPNVLLFSFGTHAREHMMDFGGWLVHKRGLLSNFDLTVNPQAERLQPRSAQAVETDQEVEVGVFSRQLTVPDPFEAMESVAAYYGFSGVEPNAVILGWASNIKAPERFLELLRRYNELDLNVLLINIDEKRGFGERKTIDVWWKGGNNRVSLTLALVRFLTASDSWAGAEIRFLVINESDSAYSEAIQSRMDGILEAFRVQSKAVVINNVVGKKSIHDIIAYESANADLTIIGMPTVSTQSAASYMSQTGKLIDRLGTTLLVSASTFFNELSVGIETTVLVQDPTELKTDEVLPALELPEDETLRWALQRFGVELGEVTNEFADQPLVTVADLHHDLGQQMVDAVNRAFSGLARSVEKLDRPRARKTSQRTQSALAFQAQEQISSFMEQQLPMQQKVLEAAVLKVRSGLRSIVRQSPDELTPSHGSAGATSGGSGESRLQSLFRGSRSKTVPFKDLVEMRGAEDYQQLVLDAIENTCSTSHELVEAILVQLRNSFDSLERIAVDLESGTATSASIAEEHEQRKQEIESMLEEYQNRQQATRHSLRVEAHGLVQKIANEVDGWAARLPQNKALQDQLGADLVEAPVRWEDNQRLLLSRANLGVQLISIQQRLRAIVQRHQELLLLALQNQVVKPLREVEKGVDALSGDQRSEAETRIRAGATSPTTFDPVGLYDQFAADIRVAIEEIPESIRTLPEAAVQSVVDHPFEEVDAITVSLRRVIDYTVKMELLGPIQEELADWPTKAQRSYSMSQDILRLVNFKAEDSSADSEVVQAPDVDDTVLKSGSKRLKALLESLNSDSEELSQLFVARLEAVTQRLNPYTLTRTEGELQRYVRGSAGREFQTRIQAARSKVKSVINEQFVQLLYSRSEGVLLARQLQESDPYVGASAIGGLRLVESVSPTDKVLRDLPMFYRQLFLDLPTITQEFWVGAEDQLQRANQAVERWKQGRAGGLLVLGEAYSGKTAFCQLLAQSQFKRDQIFQLNPVKGGSIDPEVFERKLRETLGVSGTIDEWPGQLPARSVVILNDLERWWERSEDGTAVLSLLETIIGQLGRRCLFLVNANVHTLKLIDRIYPFTQQFLDIITRSPSNAEQIKEVILLRHRSAGLRFLLDDVAEDNVSAWRLARMFTSLFDFSRGNVGTALQGWIAAVTRVSSDGLVVEPLESPDMSILDTTAPLQKALLLHVLLHGSLTFDRLLRISEIEESLLRHEIQLLERLGWITNDNGVLAVDRYLRPHLTHAFVARRLIG